jgi:hypothetical protein
MPGASAYMMNGYLCIVDDSGDEVPGSRRPLKNVRLASDYAAIWDGLSRRMAEGCRVEHSDRLRLEATSNE